ncbi:MAG: type I 3-dehydroquinate dehydratase [Spirochaetota bacterium]
MLCVCIAEKNADDVSSALAGCEFAEIRLDAGAFSAADTALLFGRKEVKLIATYRPGNASDETRIEILNAAIDAGAACIDIEVENSDAFKQAVIPRAKEKGVQVIVSYHNYENTPQCRELEEVIRWCRDSGADIIKISCAVHTRQEAARILSLYQYDFPIVALGMGEFGRITRVASVLLGAPFTYVSPEEGRGTAPGQIGRARMQEIIGLIQQG